MRMLTSATSLSLASSFSSLIAKYLGLVLRHLVYSFFTTYIMYAINVMNEIASNWKEKILANEP